MKKIILALMFLSHSVLAREIQVDIVGFRFEPNNVKAEEGDVVVFTNRDRAPHTVVPAEDSAWQFADSAVLNRGDTFKLEVGGDFPINVLCGIHSRMPGMSILKFVPATH